jgi:hypothetical protein
MESAMGYRCSIDAERMDVSRRLAASRAMDGVPWRMTRP